MGLTVSEITDFARRATDAMSQIKWFHGWNIVFRTSPLHVIKKDIVIILSAELMKACRVTSATKPSEAKRRIEEHMSILFDGKELSINIDGGEGIGIRTKVVQLRCEIPEDEQSGFANFLKYELKYKVEAYRNELAESLEQRGYFGSEN